MTESSSTTSRRGFARYLGAAAAAPVLLPAAELLGQTATPVATPTPTPVPAPDAPSAAAEALTEIARLRWGKQLSGEQLGEIAKAIDGRLKGAEAMRKVKLTNADEPDVVFSVEAGGGR